MFPENYISVSHFGMFPKPESVQIKELSATRADWQRAKFYPHQLIPVDVVTANRAFETYQFPNVRVDA